MYNLAKSKKPNKIAEELIKPFVLQMTKIVFGKLALKKLESVALSNNIVQGQISGLSSDILNQVIANIKVSPMKVSLWRMSSTIEKKDKTCSNRVCCIIYFLLI